jgi:hypothetical protein
MSKGSNQQGNINESLFGGETIKWYHYLIHLGYYIPYWLRFFFSRPFKKKKKDLNILDQVGSLLSVDTTTDILDKCEQLIGLHRVVENTRARRRLERWSLRVIVCYLLIVFCIVVLSYCSTDWMKPVLKIPEPIMITILSTTTINIIGLGLIVLRGHFLFNDQAKDQTKGNKSETVDQEQPPEIPAQTD